MTESADIERRVVETLQTVYDPELPANIYDLGLVYEISVRVDGYVRIKMTLTAPGCPVAGDILMEVERKIREIPGVTNVNVLLTFEPPWRKDMMSEEAKLELGLL